jgi:hypothetical protein
MHNFFVPITNQVVTKPKKTEDQQLVADELDKYSRYRVFGMTARILVDAARYAYDQYVPLLHLISTSPPGFPSTGNTSFKFFGSRPLC